MNALTYIASSDGFRLVAAGVLVPAVAWSLAWLITSINRRASAATHHLIWLMAFAAMAAWVPFAVTHFEIAVPILPPKPLPQAAPVKLPVFIWQEKAEPRAVVPFDPFSASPPSLPLEISSADPIRNAGPTTSIPTEVHRTPSWLLLLLALWVFGFVVLALNFLVGVLDLRRVIRASRIPDDEALAALYSELFARIGLRKPPGLLISARVAVPLVTGLWRPRVILPETARDWPLPMLRAALIHELAHVRRNDLFASAFARLVVAIYWFNPFAWFGLRALQAEAEMAADDGVVNLESQPVFYAENLVALVCDLRKGAGSPFPAIGMLRRAGIEARVARILNPSCRRTAPDRQIQWVACCIVAFLAAAFAVLRPVAAAPVPVRPINGSTVFEPFTPEPFSMDLGYTDFIKINEHQHDIVHYLPAGKGLRYGLKFEPLLSPARSTPFDIAVKSKSVWSVCYQLDDLRPLIDGKSWNFDSPGPGYREQRDVHLDGAGFPQTGPIMSNGFN